MDDDGYGPYGTKLGEVYTGFMPYEEFRALAHSFDSPMVFLHAVEDFLKQVNTVFESKQISEDGEMAFLKKPNSGNLAASRLSRKLDSIIEAWHFASAHNQEVAAFKIDTLKNLKSMIYRENEDISEAFCRADNELGRHRFKHDLAARIHETHGKTESPLKAVENLVVSVTVVTTQNKHRLKDDDNTLCLAEARDTGSNFNSAAAFVRDFLEKRPECKATQKALEQMLSRECIIWKKQR